MYKKVLRNQGIALMYGIILGVIVVVAAIGAASFFLFSKGSDSYVEEVHEKVAEALEFEGVISDGEEITFTHQNNRYVRGKTTSGKEFYAVRTSSVWNIIDSGTSCERMRYFGFPSRFISGCQSEYGDVKNISDIASGGSSDEDVIIVGIVTPVNDPSCSGCFAITTEDGSSATVVADGNAPGANNLVVVTGTPGVGSDGSVTITSSETTQITDDEDISIVKAINDDDDSDDDTNDSNNNNDSNNDSENSVSDSETTVIPPAPSPIFIDPITGKAYNIYDIDNSDVGIQIIGDPNGDE